MNNKIKIIMLSAAVLIVGYSSAQSTIIEPRRSNKIDIHVINNTDSTFRYLNFSIACYDATSKGTLLIYPDRLQRKNDTLIIYLNDTTRVDHKYEDGLADTIKKLAGLYVYDSLAPETKNIWTLKLPKDVNRNVGTYIVYYNYLVADKRKTMRVVFKK